MNLIKNEYINSQFEKGFSIAVTSESELKIRKNHLFRTLQRRNYCSCIFKESFPDYSERILSDYDFFASTSVTLMAASLNETADITESPELSIISFASMAFVPCNLTMTGTFILPIDL